MFLNINALNYRVPIEDSPGPHSQFQTTAENIMLHSSNTRSRRLPLVLVDCIEQLLAFLGS